jgi:hypothetical protein
VSSENAESLTVPARVLLLACVFVYVALFVFRVNYAPLATTESKVCLFKLPLLFEHQSKAREVLVQQNKELIIHAANIAQLL